MFEWSSLWVLLLLPLPWIVHRYLPPHREKVRALRFPFFKQLAAASGSTPRKGAVVLQHGRVEILLASVIWVLLLLALAQPERLGEPIETTKAARDVILAIDISGSMDETDFLDSNNQRIQRLAAVKDVVGEFIEQRDGDRVALIVFGSKAFIQSPFTEDLATVRELLEGTEVGMAGPHTVIGDAIGLSIRTFEASEVEQRLLILLSDGADTDSRMTPLNAANIAADRGVEIFTVAVGDPDDDSQSENQVDIPTLKEIAARANGEFFFAGDQEALETIYARIDELTPRKVEVLSYQRRENLAYIPLMMATLLVVTFVFRRYFLLRRRMAP
ncbi:MAG: VWA domain-containing protein [Candidatus Pelagadaptatus aseana]|uniref:VWA domain-containing protein n=1 Tax=Candidatus Pelagadaptatus aseana TaxID=3120508 RepID=UPI0039B25291